MDELEITLPNSEEGNTNSTKIPDDAFLILEGFKVLPLLDETIDIGRRFENRIVIDDPRISRYHAQLRARDGSYELIDLDSTGGTYINGKRITRSILYPEDVISLAGVTLIYKQHDAPPRVDMRATEPFSESDSDNKGRPPTRTDRILK